MTDVIAPPRVERPLEASPVGRGRRLPARELRIELALSALFCALGALLIALTPGSHAVEPMAVAAVVAYAIASRVDYPIATGVAVPTQPFLVALFAHADPAVVPLLAMGGLTLGTCWAALAGRTRWDRLSLAGGDALYALGPATVLALTGRPPTVGAGALAIAGALLAQGVVEFVASTARNWLTEGIRPRIPVLVLAQVWTVDAALTPLGVLAVAASDEAEWAFLALLPLVALVAHTARDRAERTERLRERLEALERERRRLRIAVRRIGDAFASNLDLDALVEIVGRAAAEALDAEASRAGLVAGPELVARMAAGDHPGLVGLLAEAERAALAGRRLAAVERDGAFAVASPFGTPGAPVAVVALARAARPFGADELALLAHLTEQAAVSAHNVLRHEALHEQALTDELTGLANHRRLQEALKAATAEHVATGRGLALVLLDLDDFKQVNDRFGHQTGDLVLRRVGRCLRAVCRDTDEPARYGGEELAVVLADTDAERAAAFAERVRQAMETLVLQDPHGERLAVTVSVGLAVAGPRASSPVALIAAADRALYDAKLAGKNCVRVARLARHDHPGRRRREDLEEELVAAVEREQLSLEYQPKLSLAGDEVVGVEALLRWQHPRLGLLGPPRFLSYLEGTPLMPQVTAWVLERAMRQAVAWRAMGMGLEVAVNVAAEDLARPELPAVIGRLLALTGARPHDLRLEIGEHLAMSDAELAVRALGELRTLGIGLSLDDFGSGYSSLARLRDLPVDELKLDGELLRAAPSDADLAVVRAAISLGRDLGLTVVAEGVEDAGRLSTLRSLGCDLAQGYGIAPPLLPDALERLIASRRAWASPSASTSTARPRSAWSPSSVTASGTPSAT